MVIRGCTSSTLLSTGGRRGTNALIVFKVRCYFDMNNQVYDQAYEIFRQLHTNFDALSEDEKNALADQLDELKEEDWKAVRKARTDVWHENSTGRSVPSQKPNQELFVTVAFT